MLRGDYKLKEYHVNLADIDVNFKKYLIEEYIKNYDSLLENNDRRVLYLFLSKKYSILCLIFILVASLLFLINFFKKPDEIKKVDITNIQSIENTLTKIKANTDSILKKDIKSNLHKTNTLNSNKNGK